jgi:alkylation response protein AidB-like acyl-CoA dehydrogenase
VVKTALAENPLGTAPRPVAAANSTRTVVAVEPITFGAESRPSRLVTLESAASVESALDLARALGTGSFESTAQLWSTLASIAAIDLGAARVIEPHLDALSILSQARVEVDTMGTWGVFASEAPGTTLEAKDGRLTGVKQWCSLAGRLDRALVTASGRLWSVDLRDEGVHVDDSAWRARGLVEIPSGPVQFTDVPVTPVGEEGWYLARPGFHWGGIGVAACWFGGAVAIARSVFDAAQARPGDLVNMHLGALDEQLEACRNVFAQAALAVDRREPGRILAKRVRATVARTVEDVLLRAGHALGPAPLALDAVHAKRVADLQLYVRQHHAERDLASLGASLLGEERRPW